MKIRYRNFSNPSQEKEVKKLLKQLRKLIPRKILTFEVLNYNVKNETEVGKTCSVAHSTEYLFVTLSVYDIFFSLPEEMKIKTLIHELTHLQCSEFTDLAKEDMLDYIREHNQPMAQQFHRLIERAEEVLVTQIAHFISESISGNKRI